MFVNFKIPSELQKALKGFRLRGFPQDPVEKNSITYKIEPLLTADMSCFTTVGHNLKAQFRRIKLGCYSRFSTSRHRGPQSSAGLGSANIHRQEISSPHNVRKDDDPFGSLLTLLGGQAGPGDQYV